MSNPTPTSQSPSDRPTTPPAGARAVNGHLPRRLPPSDAGGFRSPIYRRGHIPTWWFVLLIGLLGVAVPNLLIWTLVSAGNVNAAVISLLGYLCVCAGVLVSLAAMAFTLTYRRPRRR